MRNEMGNTNTTGIQEEEGAAYTKAPQQEQEAAALHLNDPDSSNDHNDEKLTLTSRNEQDVEDKERASHISEVELEAKDSHMEESSEIKTLDPIKEVERHEEPEKPKNGENNQSCIQSSTHSETATGEVAKIDSNLDSMSDPFTHMNGPEVDDSCNDDDDETNQCMQTETEHTTGSTVASGIDVEDADKENNHLMMKETAYFPVRLIDEEEIVMSSGDKVEDNHLMVKETASLPERLIEEGDIVLSSGENGLENEGDEEENLEPNLGKTDLPSKQEEECMILPEEIKIPTNETEHGKNNIPVDQTDSIEPMEMNEFNIGNSEKESISCLETESIEPQILAPNNKPQPHIDAKDSIPIVLTDETISILHNHEEENASNTTTQILVANEARGIPRLEKEQPQNGEQCANGQCANGIISPLPTIRSKMKETTRRYSVDYSSLEQTANHIETRRAPSFDFGIPFDARSSESDQTPLLRPEKPQPTRRLSIDFQNTALLQAATFGRDSLDYDTMRVEEKTIRVQRNDSEAQFLIKLKKEENGNVAEEKTESFVADIKENEVALASHNGGNGKRKPLPSFFSTCICCIASSN